MMKREEDIKTEVLAKERKVCRICLQKSEFIMENVAKYRAYYLDLANIDVDNNMNFPTQICYVCARYLKKCYKFKKIIIKSHEILCNKVFSNDPISFDDAAIDLSELTLTSLTTTSTLVINVTQEDETEIYNHEEETKDFYSDCFVEIDAKSIKEEMDFSDQEDDISLQKIKENSSQKLVVNSEVVKADVKLKKKRKNASKTDKPNRKKRVVQKKLSIATNNIITPSDDIDPTKIKEIILSVEEQHKMREEELKNPRYLKFPFKCEACIKGFNYEMKLANHMKKHDKSRGKHVCKICGMHLPTVHSFKMHTITHARRFECLKCGLKMIDKNCIVQHYKSVHEGLLKQFKCDICGKISNNKMTHRGHMKNVHGSERPACHLCGKSFVNKDSLYEHILIHEGIKNHECKLCSKKFRTTTQLKTHSLSHSDDRKFYCVECDVRFKSAHSLRQHFMKSKAHVDTSALKFKCGLCGERQVSASALAHHIEWGHEKRRLFACNECSARFATRSSLNKHTRVTHRGFVPPRSYACNTCGRAFRAKSVLLNHVRTHTGEKPFECEQCNKKFAQKTALTTHVKLVHLKQKRRGATRKMYATPVSIKSEEVSENKPPTKVFLTEEQVKLLQSHPTDTPWPVKVHFHSDHSYFNANNT